MLLVQRGLAETRERAQALVMAGAVVVDDRPVTRPGLRIPRAARLEVRAQTPPYVSRGAYKLIAALDGWQLNVERRVALDVGASTGGFTDLLLQRGARRVYAVDVGYGQLHHRLRTDPRVVVMERTNVRYLGALPERPELAVVDVSFISLRLALPPVFALLDPDAPVVALVKPQFEAGREQVSRGGVVRDERTHRAVLEGLARWSGEQPWRLADLLVSPLKGPAGNVEFLSLWRRSAPIVGAAQIERALAASRALTAHHG